MDVRKKVLSGLGWSVGLRFLGQFVTWSITLFVMRLLSPQDFGIMGMGGVLVSYLAMVNELGLGTALIQKRNFDDHLARQILGLLLATNMCLFIICVLTAPFAATFFGEPRLSSIIRLLSIQFIISSFSIVPQALILREMLFKQKAVMELISAIAGSLVTLGFAISGLGVLALVYGSLTLSLCRAIGLNVIKPYLKGPRLFRKANLSVITFGGYFTISRVLWVLYSQSDIIIAGKLLGTQMVGAYSVALKCASLPMEKLSGVVNQVGFPAFSAIQNDVKRVAAYFLKSIRIMSALSVPLLWGLSSIAPDFVDLILGNKWSVATRSLQILSITIPLRMINNLMSPALLGIGRADIVLGNVIRNSAVLPLSFVVGANWGIEGISIVWATVFPLVALYNLSRMAKLLEVTVLTIITPIFRPAMAGLVMYLSVMIGRLFVRQWVPLVRVSVLVMIGALIYTTMIYSINKEGCDEIRDIFRKPSRPHS